MPVFFFFLEADQRLSLFGDFDFSFDAVIQHAHETVILLVWEVTVIIGRVCVFRMPV